MLLVMGLIVAETALLANRQRTAKIARLILTEKQQEHDAIHRLSPSLTEENARAMAADTVKASQMLTSLRQTLAEKGGAAEFLRAPWPVTRMDAYLEIAAFVEKTRALAAKAKVAVNPDECFGFATCAHQGPEGEYLRPVVRQCRIMQCLLERLIDTRPCALLAAQREPPLGAAQRAACGAENRPAGRSGPGAVPVASMPRVDSRDFFNWDRKMSVSVPGCIDTEAFRLQFTGPTSVLRVFLNALVAQNPSLFVCLVEAEPVAASGPALPAGADGSTSSVLLVRSTMSKFTVVIEHAELLQQSQSLGMVAVPQ